MTVPPSPVAITVGRKRSTCSRSAAPASAQCAPEVVEHLVRPAGPGLPLGQVGDQLGQLGRGDPAVGAGVPLDQPDPAGGGERRAARRRRRRRRASGAECTTTTSSSSCRALRSMPMTGVMPLPAVTNSTFAGRGGRQGEVAGRLVQVHEHARRRALRIRWLLTAPSRTALTVTDEPAPGGAGHRVRAPQPYAVDVDADPHVLAGLVRPPAATGPQHQGDAVAGLAAGPPRSGRAARRRCAAARPRRGSRPAPGAS